MYYIPGAKGCIFRVILSSQLGKCLLHSLFTLLHYNSLPCGHLANVQEKWMHNTGEMPWNRGDPSSDIAVYFLFLVGCEYGIHAFYCKERDLIFIWICL